MTPPSEALRALANKMVTNSIVAQATERLILQIVEVCAEHEQIALAALTAERDEALREIGNMPSFTSIDQMIEDVRAQAFADAIQAVDESLCDEAEDQILFMAHRDFFADAIRARVGEK